MPEPLITGASRPQTYRPAPTQPLDPAAVERATTSLAASGQAKTTALEPVAADEKQLPGLLGAVQSFVRNLFGGGQPEPAPAPAIFATSDSGTSSLELSAAAQAGLPDADPPGTKNFGLVGMTADIVAPAAPVVNPNPGSGAMRSWGMVTMDGVPPAPTQSETPASGVMRSWGMVALGSDTKPAPRVEEPTPTVFRSWGMVGMKDDTPAVVTPPRPPAPQPPAPEPPAPKPPAPQPPAPQPPTNQPPAPQPPAGPPSLSTPPLTKPGEALTKDQKALLIAQIKAVAGDDVDKLIDKLDAQGKLDIKAATGRTVLEALADISKIRLNDTSVSLGYSPKSVLEQTVRDIADPLSIKQEGENDCVWTNLRMAMSKDQPGDYAELALALYRDSEAALPGGGVVKLEDALKPFDLGGSVGKVWYQDGELWLQYKGFPAMSAEKFVGEFLNNREWIDRMLEKNSVFNNPFVRSLIDEVRNKWNEGKRQEVLEMIAPFVQMYISMKPDDPRLSGLKYAVENFRSLFQPATQAGEAVPKGLPMGRVDEFYPGLKGYYIDDNVLDYVEQAASRGAQVPMVFTTDDGTGLHMATVMGSFVNGDIIVYDPVNGARTMPRDVLRQRAAGAFLPPALGVGLSEIPDSDTRPVGGGRFSWGGGRG